MATTITVPLSPVWTKVPIEQLAWRVEAILIGPRQSSFVPFEKANSDGIWQIDCQNNWSIYVTDEVLYLVARYKYADDPLMKGLKVVLDWAVGKR
jgi:hypothetical protein